MKTKLVYSLSVAGCLSIFLLGCSKPKTAPVTITLQVLDSNGIAKQVFSESEDVILCFEITTKDSVVYYNQKFDSSFFEVYKYSNEIGGRTILIGRPYSGLITPLQLGTGLGPNKPFAVNISWYGIADHSYLSDWGFVPPTSVQPLSKGNYSTSFSGTFQFKGYEDFHFSNTCNFEVN